jgi:hypothetical protein
VCVRGRYYNVDDHADIAEIRDRWVAGDKVYDRSMPVWYTVDEIWPFRDYDRGIPPALEASMLRSGWHEDKPGQLIFGQDGNVYLGEGNHRLAVAKKHGMMVPLWLSFWRTAKRPLMDRLANPDMLTAEVIAAIDPEEIARFNKTGRVPRHTRLRFEVYLSHDVLEIDPNDPPPSRRRRPPRPPRGPHYDEPEDEPADAEQLDLLEELEELLFGGRGAKP